MTQAEPNHQQRPWDDLGPPSDPLEFPRPQVLRGRRDNVLCYNPLTDEHEVLENVLFRDFGCGRGGGRSSNSSAKDNSNVITKAFWPIPYKAKIQTIMGHVEYVGSVFFQKVNSC
jgi:hypothetical protein